MSTYFQNLNNVTTHQTLIFLFSFLLFSACNRPDETELPWQQIAVPTVEQIEGVHFMNDSIGHLVGGIAYQNGFHLATYDGGRSWKSYLFSNTVYDFVPLNSGEVIHAGFSGFQRKINREENWFIQVFPTLDFDLPPFNTVSVNADGQILLGGGIAFKNGIILRLDDDYQLVAPHTFPAEIGDITYLDNNRAVAVGYGIILHSMDSGNTWTRLPVYGDFFRSVHFPTPEIGYTVGFSGSILKSEDGGLSWTVQRDGHRLTVSDKPFRSVFFADESKGFIVGDGGLFWMTTDGGDNWEVITNLPDRNYYDVFIQNKKIYIAGSEGTLIQLDLP